MRTDPPPSLAVARVTTPPAIAADDPPLDPPGECSRFHGFRLAPLLPEREPDFGRGFISGVKLGRNMDAERWGAFRRRREELNRWCAATFSRFDLVLTPTVPYDPPVARGPLRLEVEGRRQPVANVGSFTMPFNLSWHPAATVRAGFSRAGLPVGLQIVGPRHRDDLVLQAAWAFEQAHPWGESWPEV